MAGPGDAPIHPAPVQAAIELFANLVVSCGRVRIEWDRLKAAVARVGATPIPLEAFHQLPEGVLDTPELQKIKAAARVAWPKLSAKCHDYLDCQDDMQVAVRRWRLDLDTAREALPTVEPWMDDQSLPPVKRWTADVQGELNQLGGLIDRIAVGDLPQTLNTVELERLRRALNGRLNDLKRVPRISPSATARSAHMRTSHSDRGARAEADRLAKHRDASDRLRQRSVTRQMAEEKAAREAFFARSMTNAEVVKKLRVIGRRVCSRWSRPSWRSACFPSC